MARKKKSSGKLPKFGSPAWNAKFGIKPKRAKKRKKK